MMQKDSGDQDMLFFVHILKTGGSSLKAMLQNVFPEEQRYPSKQDRKAQRKQPPKKKLKNELTWLLPYIDVNCVRELSAERKRQIRFFVGHLPYCVGELFDRKLTYVSFFRDPVARNISQIKHARTIKPQFQDKSLEEIYEDPYFFATSIHNLQTRFFAHELTDNLRMALDPMELTADDLSRARERIASLDFIGILEDFNDSVSMLGKQFGFPFETIEKRRFESKECDVPDWLPARIAEDNRHDMETYQFAKDLYYQRKQDVQRPAA